jgi:hypothetical protein
MEERNDCRHFIPLAQSELVDLLCDDPALPEAERGTFRSLCLLISASYHFQYLRRLRELKADYAPFDPDSDTVAVLTLTAEQRQARANALFREFAWVMERANFSHLSREQIEPVLDSASAWGLRMDVDFGAFEHLAIFARGDALQKRTRRAWWRGYRREEIDVPVYRRLVLILKLRPHPRLGPEADTRNIYLKIFKDVPKLDVMMLLPGARVRISRFDRSKIGFPLLSGIGLMIYNFLNELMQLFEQAILSPNAAWGLAIGSVGYGYRSYYGYQQTRQRYHLSLTRSLYFQNLDSNAGVLMRLLDEAEEQECRTTLLAYFCLHCFAGPEGWGADELDAAMELYLDRYADLPLLCRPGDALAELRKLGLIEPMGDRFRALPPTRAVEVLQSAWNDFFVRQAAREGGLPSRP